MNEFFEKIKIRKVLLVYIGVVTFLAIISELPVVKSSIKLSDENLFGLLCNIGILIWFTFKLMKARVDVKKRIVNLRNDLRFKDIALSILINVTLCIGFILTLAYVLLYFWPSAMSGFLNELNETGPTPSLYSTLINAIAAVFLAPIVEEFICRGVLLNRLKLKIGVKKAIIISSVIFGILHVELGIISAIVFGICMSLIYLRTNNIFVPIAIHFINNLITSSVQVISFFASNGAVQESITINDINISWLIGGGLSLIASIIMFIYFVKENKTKVVTSL